MSKIENISKMIKIKQESSSKNALTLCKTLSVTTGALLLAKLDSTKNIATTIRVILEYPFTVINGIGVTCKHVFFIPKWFTILMVVVIAGMVIESVVINMRKDGKKK